MTHRQIMDRAIRQAKRAGWKPDGLQIYDVEPEWPIIIFNQRFAKALWGEQENDITTKHEPRWRFHLQQMVIAEDPIKYLGEHI